MEFIEKYARADGSEDEMEQNDDTGGDEVNQLDLDFIDDETNFQDQESIDYHLMNVTRDLEDAIAERSMAFDLDLVAVDSENFVSDFVDEVSYEFDEFFGFEKRIRKFDEELNIFEKESKNSFTFLYPMLSIITCSKKRKILISAKTRKEVLGQIFFENIKLKKYSLKLNPKHFHF